MKKINWKNAIYYGEVFGFVFAWAVGLVVAFGGSQQDKPSSDSSKVVSARPAQPTLD